MATSVSSDVSSNQSWFTPLRLLVLFCVIHLLNYMDRGVISSNGVNGIPKTCGADGTCTSGSGIQGQFRLNNFQDGILSSAFMVGLLLACPIFASLSKRVNPFRLIGVGLSVWTLAVIGCGFSFNFWSIVVCRMIVGVGEASFISLAAPFIYDNAPAHKRTGWIAILYMCMPTGYAIGYLYGGFVGERLGWRYAFWGEAILMFPFAIFGFVVKPLQYKGSPSRETVNAPLPVDTATSLVKDLKIKDGTSHKDLAQNAVESSSNSTPSFLKDLKALLVDKVFVVNVLGFVVYTFVIGAYSYWGPKAGYSIYQMKNADMIFGGITVVCGIIGTISGGYALDYLGTTISNAFKLLSSTTFIGAAFCFGAFCFKNMYAFLVFFSVGELLLFATQGPVNFVCLHCVTPSLRPLSMAMSTVAIHIFGDVPSSPLVGVLEDHLNNWRKTTLILTTIFFPAAIIWFIEYLPVASNGVNWIQKSCRADDYRVSAS
ncbi:probable sphingolipid transporter spinster homolog 2 [Cucurbita pepo subsp. pepo]|uniref:probable sphingolipid transporter spinster homolog 2 n=1 Tax=Cucurbita pepo subsp. pepo TaxID=3664 RepID=UPI000C9D8A85|nr:probable sphingolipid transporter spinster homolog 2 [Cucurbita pepo subsp. pepo]